MAQAENGNTVRVHYTGKLEDGTVFDSSVERDPLEFELGSGQLIPGFEEGVLGLAPGESRSVTIPPEKAYGPHHEDGVLEVDRSELPEDLEPAIGQQLQASQADGQTLVVAITEIDGDKVTLDANHPLAGKTLTFDIELVEIV